MEDKTVVDYAKAHSEETAKKLERKKEKKKIRARNRQKAEKLQKEERRKHLSELQAKALERLEEKKAKRADKIALETCPVRKELRKLKHARIRSFSVD